MMLKNPAFYLGMIYLELTEVNLAIGIIYMARYL